MGRRLPIVFEKIWVCVSRKEVGLVLTPGCSHNSTNIKQNKRDTAFVDSLSPFVAVTDAIFVGDRLQEVVQDWLSPPNPSTNQSFVRKSRHTGTAAWFFESSAIAEWKAKGSLLWIHGKRTSFKSPMDSSL